MLRYIGRLLLPECAQPRRASDQPGPPLLLPSQPTRQAERESALDRGLLWQLRKALSHDRAPCVPILCNVYVHILAQICTLQGQAQAHLARSSLYPVTISFSSFFFVRFHFLHPRFSLTFSRAHAPVPCAPLAPSLPALSLLLLGLTVFFFSAAPSVFSRPCNFHQSFFFFSFFSFFSFPFLRFRTTPAAGAASAR